MLGYVEGVLLYLVVRNDYLHSQVRRLVVFEPSSSNIPSDKGGLLY